MEIQAVQLLNEEDGPRPSVQAPSAFEATRKVYWFALRNALLLLASSGRRSSGTPGTAPSGDLFTPSTVMAVDGEATSALVNETAALVENAEVIANARSVFNAARIFASALEAFEHGGQIAAAALHVDAATLNQSIAAQTASRKYQMLAVGSIVAAPLVGWLASKLFKRRAPIALGKGRR
jgi:hypothetical protein